MSDSLTASQIRKDGLRITGIEMPIAGGDGSTKDNPIIIEDTDPSRSAYWEHQVVGFIQRMRNENYKFEKATVEDYDGKTIEQYKLSREGDDEFFYNYYFDVSLSQAGGKQCTN